MLVTLVHSSLRALHAVLHNVQNTVHYVKHNIYYLCIYLHMYLLSSKWQTGLLPEHSLILHKNGDSVHKHKLSHHPLVPEKCCVLQCPLLEVYIDGCLHVELHTDLFSMPIA